MSGNRSTRASDVGVLASDAVQRAYRQATGEAVSEQVWLTQVRLVVYFIDLSLRYATSLQACRIATATHQQ